MVVEPIHAVMSKKLDEARAAALSGKVDEALAICQKVLDERPDFPEGLALLGSILIDGAQPEVGCNLIETALSKKPGELLWLSTLCRGYLAQGALEKALVSCLRLIDAKPGVTGHRLDLAQIHLQRGEYDAAESVLVSVIDMETRNARAHAMLGEVLLMKGDYRRGWFEYSWKWRQTRTFDWIPQDFPLWLGAPMAEDRNLLIFSDGGISETIQFCRYIPFVAQRCPNVVLACAENAMSLMKGLRDLRAVVSKGDVAADVAAVVPMSHLPGIFDSHPGTIPVETPYLFVEGDDLEGWRSVLEKEGGKGQRTVGFAWPSDLRTPGTRAPVIPMELFAGIADVPDVTLVSLQRIVAENGVELPTKLLDFSDRLRGVPLRALAGLVASLDHIITADPFIAHLGGALGKPVWLMLGKHADWRWMQNGDRTPWYPTVRIFRQDGMDWVHVFDDVAYALRSEIRH